MKNAMKEQIATLQEMYDGASDTMKDEIVSKVIELAATEEPATVEENADATTANVEEQIATLQKMYDGANDATKDEIVNKVINLAATENNTVEETAATEKTSAEKFLEAKEEIRLSRGRYLGNDRFADQWQRHNGFRWYNISKKTAAFHLEFFHGLTIDEFLAEQKIWVDANIARSLEQIAAEDALDAEINAIAEYAVTAEALEVAVEAEINAANNTVKKNNDVATLEEILDEYETAYKVAHVEREGFTALIGKYVSGNKVEVAKRIYGTVDEAINAVRYFARKPDKYQRYGLVRAGRELTEYFTFQTWANLRQKFTAAYYGTYDDDTDVFSLLPALDELNDVEDDFDDTSDALNKTTVFNKDGDEITTIVIGDEVMRLYNGELWIIRSLKYCARWSNMADQIGWYVSNGNKPWRKITDADEFFKEMAMRGACTIEPGTPEPDDNFTAELAKLQAQVESARAEAEDARDAFRAAQKVCNDAEQNCIAADNKAYEAEAAIEKFIRAKATALTKIIDNAPDIITAPRMAVTLQGGEVKRMKFDNLAVNYLNGKFLFDCDCDWQTLAEYDTPAQVETVIGELRAAIAHGSKKFTFPTFGTQVGGIFKELDAIKATA